MKLIGLVDFYISEWHANNYPIWIKELCSKNGYDYKIAYAYAEQEVSPVSGETTDEWCKRMEIERCYSIDELCEKCDNIIILAPSDPEKHLFYAQEVLKYGKRTYIDKTFAPDLDIAKKIFDISKKHNAPFFSTSALRYADELSDLSGVNNLIITGGGSNLPEYAIHQIEIAVSLLKSSPLALKLEKQGSGRIITIEFEDDKHATLVYSPSLPFTICAETENGEEYRNISSDFFNGLMIDIINFFETGEVSFDPCETLDCMKIRGGIIEAEKTPSAWVSL